MVNPDSEMVKRRAVLGWSVGAVISALSGTMATLSGGAILAPVRSRAAGRSIDLGPAGDLTEGVPREVTLRVEREDGYQRVVEQRTVFLVKDETGVRALSATCTPLGCRVAWDTAGKEFRCPCHGGRFDAQGRVTGGPPPRPLDAVPTRLEGDRILVDLA